MTCHDHSHSQQWMTKPWQIGLFSLPGWDPTGPMSKEFRRCMNQHSVGKLNITANDLISMWSSKKTLTFSSNVVQNLFVDVLFLHLFLGFIWRKVSQASSMLISKAVPRQRHLSESELTIGLIFLVSVEARQVAKRIWALGFFLLMLDVCQH